MRPIVVIRRTRDLLLAGTSHAMRSDSVTIIHGIRRDGTEPANARDVRNALAITYPEAVFTG